MKTQNGIRQTFLLTDDHPVVVENESAKTLRMNFFSPRNMDRDSPAGPNQLVRRGSSRVTTFTRILDRIRQPSERTILATRFGAAETPSKYNSTKPCDHKPVYLIETPTSSPPLRSHRSTSRSPEAISEDPDDLQGREVFVQMIANGQHARDSFRQQDTVDDSCSSDISDSDEEISKVEYVKIITEGHRARRKSRDSSSISERSSSSWLSRFTNRSKQRRKQPNVQTISTRASQDARHSSPDEKVASTRSNVEALISKSSALALPNYFDPEDHDDEAMDVWFEPQKDERKESFVPPEFIAFAPDDNSAVDLLPEDPVLLLDRDLVFKKVQENFEAMKAIHTKLERARSSSPSLARRKQGDSPTKRRKCKREAHASKRKSHKNKERDRSEHSSNPTDTRPQKDSKSNSQRRESRTKQDDKSSARMAHRPVRISI